MSNFQAARKNMIDGQIHTAGVIDPQILEIFETTPREEFVPEELISVAYQDEDLPIGHDRFLMEPIIHSKMLQAAGIKKEDLVLDVGFGMGYSTAIISQMASTVFAIEDSQTLIDIAQENWNTYGFCNIVAESAVLVAGLPQHGPFDVILINGALREIPDELKQQMAIDGRLLCVEKPEAQSVGKAVLLTRLDENSFSKIILFDAATPILKPFESSKRFVF